MKNFFEARKKLFIILWIFGLLVGWIWLNSERGEPMGIVLHEMTVSNNSTEWENAYNLLNDSVPEEWWKPEYSPARYRISAEISRVTYDICHTNNPKSPETRYTSDLHMKIMDLTTHEFIAEKTFRGIEPAPCQGDGRVVPALTGMVVAIGVVEDWVIETLSLESTLPALEEPQRTRSGIYSGSSLYVKDLPSEWFVDVDSYPRYQLKVRNYSYKIDCEYGVPFGQRAVRTIEQITTISSIEVLDLDTNEKLATRVIYGSKPEECPESVKIGDITPPIRGEPPDSTKMTGYIRVYLEPLMTGDD